MFVYALHCLLLHPSKLLLTSSTELADLKHYRI